MSGMGPEVLCGSNQKPKMFSIPSLYLLLERTYLRHQTRYILFLSETSYPTFVKNKQINKPWTWSKSKRMTLGPLQLESSQHNTNFYLKDLTWSGNDNNMYLGPVVAAQQVLDPSPPRKEKKRGGGAHLLQPSLQESNPKV